MDHKIITAERGRRAEDLRKAAVAALEQQSIASGVLLDLDDDTCVAAGPKVAILQLLNSDAADRAESQPTDEFMVYGRAGNRRVDLEAKLRDALGLAATSGDAPTAEKVTCAECKGTGYGVVNAYAEAGGCSDCSGKGYNWEPVEVASLATASGDELPSIDTPEFRELLAAAGQGETRRDAWGNFVAHIDGKIRAAASTKSGDLYEAFKAAFLSWNGFHTESELAKEWAYGTLAGEMFRAGAAVSAATKPTADLSKLRDLADAYRDASPISKVGERCNLDIAFDELAVYVQSLLATKPAAAPALPTEWRATLEHAANKLVTMSRVLAPDEEASRLITELRTVSEALASGAEGAE